MSDHFGTKIRRRNVSYAKALAIVRELVENVHGPDEASHDTLEPVYEVAELLESHLAINTVQEERKHDNDSCNEKNKICDIQGTDT